MTKLEYKKIKMERRRKCRELWERAKSVGFVYPYDLHYFWEYMQDKNIGLSYCLGMIYQLGYVDAKNAPVSPTKETTDAQTTPETGCQGHCITVSGGNQEENLI